MPQTTEVLKLARPDAAMIARVKAYLAGHEYALREVRDGSLSGRGPAGVVTLYATGRLVVQGPEAAMVMGAVKEALGDMLHRRDAKNAKVSGAMAVAVPASLGVTPSESLLPPQGAYEGMEVESKEGALPPVTVYTDGACMGNPGPGGYGAVMLHGEKRKELSGGYRLMTNNRMEMMGCIAALEALKKPCRVTLYSDSQYVVNAIAKGWAARWKSKGWKRGTGEPAINPDLWERLLGLCRRHQVEFRWVRGHNGNAENERCDELAVAASKIPRLAPDPGYRP